MKVRDAKEQLKGLVADFTEQRGIAESARQQAMALQKIIRSYVELFPELAEEVPGGVFDLAPAAEAEPVYRVPKGAEAVRAVLHEYTGKRFLVSELVSELRERGWLPDSDNPANAIRAALERLVALSDSNVYKNWVGEKVTYYYDPDEAGEPF